MRHFSIVLIILAVLSTFPRVQAMEAASEVTGFVEVDVTPGSFAPIAPLFSPLATGTGRVTAVTNEGSVTLALGGNTTDAATSWWRPASGKAVGKTVFGTLTSGQLGYATQYGGTPGAGAASASVLQTGDLLRLTPFWMVDEFLGSPADGLFTTNASLYNADQFTWGSLRGWANDDGTQKFWAQAGSVPASYVGDVALTRPLDGMTFFRNSADPAAEHVVLTFKGSAAIGDTLFNIVPGNWQQSGVFRTDGKPFTLADSANTAGGLLTSNPATGLVGGASPDKADFLGLWSDADQQWIWVYYNTVSHHWLATNGQTITEATTRVPGGMMVYIDRPASSVAGTVKMSAIDNTVSTSTTPLPVVDRDHDNLRDSWEVTYDLVNHKDLKPGDDLDQDGYTNLQEFLLGGDPNVFDHPAIPTIALTGPAGSKVVTITFQTTPGCHYRVETRRGDETAWRRVPVSDGVTELDGDGTSKTLTDSSYVFQSRMPRFYRVVGMPPLDTDKDGVSDWEEINVYHTNPYSKDTDQDGIPDLTEILKGTDPRGYIPVLTTVAGNAQYQQPGGWLPQGVVVSVKTSKNAVLPFEPVTFVFTHGKGVFAASPGGSGAAIFKTRTDATGKATAFVQLDAGDTTMVQGVCLSKVNGIPYTSTFIAYPTPNLSVPTTGLQGWFSAGKGVTTATGTSLVNSWQHTAGSLDATGTGTARPTSLVDTGRPWVSFNGYQKMDMGTTGLGDTFGAYFVAQPSATRTAPAASTAYGARLAGVTGQRYLLGSPVASGSSPYVVVPPPVPAPIHFSVWKQVYFPPSDTSLAYVVPTLPTGIDPSIAQAAWPIYRGDDTVGYRESPAPVGQHTSQSLAAHEADLNKVIAAYWTNYSPGTVTHTGSYATLYGSTTQQYTQEDYYEIKAGAWKGTGGTINFTSGNVSNVGFALSAGSNSMGTFELHSDYYPSTSGAAATGTAAFMGAVEVSSRLPTLWVSGVLKVTGAASSSSSFTGPSLLGGFGGTGSGFVGRLGEMLLYDHPLSVSDRQQLQNYLAAAYRVPMADSNTDSLPDWWQMAWFGKLNAIGGGKNDDPDGDGLTNLQEYQLGTNPLAADTDGDGINDGNEVKAKTNPLAADTDGDLLPDRFDAKPTDATNGHAVTTPGSSAGMDYLIAHDSAFTDSDGSGMSDLQKAINNF